MFVVDEEATAELHRVMAELKEARERGDGSYSRMLTEAVFGVEIRLQPPGL